MLRIALKSVLARKRRLFTTGAAIVLSVAFISGTLVITALIDSTLNGLIGESFKGIDSVVRSSQAQESRFGQPIREPIPESTLELTRAAKGVVAAEGFVQGFPTMLDKEGERIQDTFGPPTLAFNWTDIATLQGGRLVAGGRSPATPDEAVIDVRTAEDYGFGVGDDVTAQFPAGLRTFAIVGIAGTPTEDDKLAAGPRFLLLEKRTAQELVKKDGFDYIAVVAETGTSETELTDTLRRVIPDDHEALTGQQFIAESEASISKVISLFTQPILAFGFISVFVGIFVIYNTFSIVVAQRTRELALLRAVGAARRQILGSVMAEAMLVGITASGLGVLSGWILANLLKLVLSNALSLPDGVPPLTVQAVVVAVIVGVGSTFVSAMIPGFRATRIAPVAALGEVAIDRSNLSRSRKVTGSLMMAAGVGLIGLVTTDSVGLGIKGIGVGAGLLFLAIATLGPVFAGPLARSLGFALPALRGVSGNIGKENAGRNPKRTAVTATALSVGVALVTVVSIFAASIRGATQAQLSNQLSAIDLILDTGTGFGGVSPDAATYLRARPEVARINPIRFNIFTILNSKAAEEERATKKVGRSGTDAGGVPVGENEFIIGVDPTAVFEMVKFDGLEPRLSEIRDGEVLVLAKTAEENGWEVGDDIEVWFAASGRQDLRIAATFTTRVGSGSEYITNLATADANSTPEFKVDSTIWISLKDGISPEVARKAIKPGLKAIAPTAGLNSVGDYLGERLAIVDSVVNLIYVLLGLSIIVALVGVGNTISLSIFERTRELGLLRAVGMARSQLGEAVGWESIIIALAGTVIGLGVGIVLAIVFVNALDEQGIEPVVRLQVMLIIGLLGALAGVGAAIRPALRATRVDVLRAITSV